MIIWLLITVVMVMTLTKPSYEEENRDDWIDPNDTLNSDPSTNTMSKNKFMILAALAAAMLLIEIRLQNAWLRRVGQLFNCIFMLWILYEKVMKMPKECKDGDSWFTCLADLVPLSMKIPLTDRVFMPFKVTAKVIAVPVEQFCTEVIPALRVDLPWILYPVAIAIVNLLLSIFLFMWFGYSIRNPFFLANELGPGYAVADAQIQQAIRENTLNFEQPEEIQSLMAKTKNPPDESVPHQSDAGAPTQIQQDEPKNTLPTNDQVEEIHFSMEETKNPPDEKDPRFPLPNLLVKGTSCPVSAENHGGAKVQLDRDHIPSTSCQNTSVNVETEMVSLHAEEGCVQHISGGKRKCVDVNRAELENELLQQRINQERELHQLNVAIMKEKNDREREQHQLTVANMK